jgi:hypothetical protein
MSTGAVLNLFGNLKLAFDDLLDEFRGSYIAPVVR